MGCVTYGHQAWIAMTDHHEVHEELIFCSRFFPFVRFAIFVMETTPG